MEKDYKVIKKLGEGGFGDVYLIEKSVQIQEKYDKTNLNNKLLIEEPEENLINKKEEKEKIDSYGKFIDDIGKDLIIKETQREIIGEEEEDDDKEAEEQRIEEMIKETSKLQIINNEPLDEYNDNKTSSDNKDNQPIDNINKNKIIDISIDDDKEENETPIETRKKIESGTPKLAIQSKITEEIHYNLDDEKKEINTDDEEYDEITGEVKPKGLNEKHITLFLRKSSSHLLKNQHSVKETHNAIPEVDKSVKEEVDEDNIISEDENDSEIEIIKEPYEKFVYDVCIDLLQQKKKRNVVFVLKITKKMMKL